MKTNERKALLQASLTSSSALTDQNDQALPSLSPSHSAGSERLCTPTLEYLIPSKSEAIKRTYTDPVEDFEPPAKRVHISKADKSITDKKSDFQNENLCDLVPSSSLIDKALPQDHSPGPTATQIEYDPAASVNSFGKSPSVQFIETFGKI